MPQTPHIEKHFTATETVRDIVIGMSDGLTVPFALAAGLSGAVDATSIVITADLAEVAAGSIAMGLGGYPWRMSEEDVPLPDVSYPGDRDWQGEWNEKMVSGIICNPICTGIPPFPKMIDDKTWIAAGVQIVENVGLRQYLVDVLYELKQSVRAVSLSG
jgi:hypothetical protein